MSVTTAQLIVSLVDRLTAPARGVAATVTRLQEAQARNAASMDAMRGRMVDAAAMAYALARAVGSPVQVAADFETAMNRVTALSGATGEQFDQLRQQAMELGRTTQFTASQAGDAMGFLAMAGFKANEILGAMPGTLQLAAAAQMDLAETADVVSNILTGYNKDVSELAHVNDVLVKAFTSANTDLSQLAEAMKYAGPIASAAGVAFEETAAAISLMGNAGIQGSMAGTSVRGALTRMLSPTKQVRAAMAQAGLTFTDTKGRLLPLADIIEQLEPHAEDAGLMMELFGQRAGPAMAALVSQGADSLRELQAELEGSAGTAERIANVQMAGFNGMMKEFWSVVEGLQIAIGNALLPVLTALGQQFIALMGPITAFLEANPMLTAAIVGTVSAFVALRVAATALRFAMLWMQGGLISSAILGLRGLQGAGRVAALAIWPLTASLRAGRTAMIGYAAAAAVAGHGGALRAMVAAMLGLLNPLRLVRVALIGIRTALVATGIGAVLVGIAMAGQWIWENWDGLGEMFAGIAEGISSAFPGAVAIVSGLVDAVSGLVGWLGSLVGPVDASAEEWRGFGVTVGQTIGGVLATIAALPGQIYQALVSGAAALRDAGLALMSMLLDGIKAGAQAVLDYVANIGSRIRDSISGVASGAWEGAKGRVQGAWSRITGNAAPAIDGARAAGGPVARGRTYLVGEEGPELFQADSNGYVHDAATSRAMLARRGGAAGGASASVSIGAIHLHLKGDGVTAREIARELDRELRERLAGLQADLEFSVA